MINEYYDIPITAGFDLWQLDIQIRQAVQKKTDYRMSARLISAECHNTSDRYAQGIATFEVITFGKDE